MSGAGLERRGAADRLDWQKQGLFAWQKRIAEAAIEAMLCDEDDTGKLCAPSPEVCARGVTWMSLSLGSSSAYLRASFLALSLVIELLPLFVVGSPRRMSRMSLEARVAYLSALEASRLSLFPLLVFAFKVPLCMPVFEEGEELISTGFDRPSTASRRKLPQRAERGGSP